MFLIYHKNKDAIFANYAPYLAMMLFFSVAWLYRDDLDWAWIFFLLIPPVIFLPEIPIKKKKRMRSCENEKALRFFRSAF